MMLFFNRKKDDNNFQVRWRKILLAYVLPTFLITALLTLSLSFTAGLYVIQIFSRMEKIFLEHPWKIPSRVYALPFSIQAGMPLQPERLQEALDRLEYEKTGQSDAIIRSGQYAWNERAIDIFIRSAVTQEGKREALRVRIDHQNEIVERIRLVQEEREVTAISLESEHLGTFFDRWMEDRVPVELAEIPEHLIQCLLVLEDQGFFEHSGIDPSGIVRASWVNMQESRYAQGGSTITQQLVRNLFLTRKRTMHRKIDEAIMAFLMERTKNKREILELYLNDCYFGQDGPVNLCGIHQAAKYYFNVEPRFLSLAQSAMLVAIIRGPNYYHPFSAAELVKARRDLILRRMRENDFIPQNLYEQSINEPMPSAPHSLRAKETMFLDLARWALRDRISMEELQTRGYNILTTIDPHAQKAAQQAVAEGLEHLEKAYPKLLKKEQRLQAALICLNAKTGAVQAVVGSRDTASGTYNRAILSKRPIGSLFKPFVYLLAFQGTKEGKYNWGPNSAIEDAPITLKTASGSWSPGNYKEKYYGRVTLRRALENSLNSPVVRLSQEIGLDEIDRFCKQLDISNFQPVPASVLGTVELSPYEVSRLYTLFANQGEIAAPRIVRSVRGINGALVSVSPERPKRLASPEASYQVLSLLEGVFLRGTARTASTMGWKGTAAGKTGTTNELKDSWFVGMTPERITVVWLGFDQPESTGLSGSQGALPIWAQFMQNVQPKGGTEPFSAPSGLLMQYVDYDSGQPLYQLSSNAVLEYLLPEQRAKQTGKLAQSALPQPESASPDAKAGTSNTPAPTPMHETKVETRATPTSKNTPSPTLTPKLDPTPTATPSKATPIPTQKAATPTPHPRVERRPETDERLDRFMNQLFGDPD